MRGGEPADAGDHGIVRSLDEGRIHDRLNALEDELDRYREENRRTGNMLLNLQTDISNKIDLQTFTAQLGKKIDKEEVVDIIKKVKKFKLKILV